MGGAYLWVMGVEFLNLIVECIGVEDARLAAEVLLLFSISEYTVDCKDIVKGSADLVDGDQCDRGWSEEEHGFVYRFIHVLRNLLDVVIYDPAICERLACATFVGEECEFEETVEHLDRYRNICEH